MLTGTDTWQVPGLWENMGSRKGDDVTLALIGFSFSAEMGRSFEVIAAPWSSATPGFSFKINMFDIIF